MSDALQLDVPRRAVALGSARRDGATREDIVDRAKARFEELFQVVVAAVFEALPEYCVGRPAGDLHDIRAGIRRATAICLAVIAADRGLDADERRGLRLTGGQWARQGIAKTALTENAKVATRVAIGFLMRCTPPSADVTALTRALYDVTRLVARFEDEAVAALSEGYDEANARLFSCDHRGEALLVDRLLERRFVDADEVLRHAGHVGLVRNRPAFVVVATAGHEVGAERIQTAAGAARSCVLLAVGPVRTEGRVHVPLVVQPGSSSEWRRVLVELEDIAATHEATLVYSDTACELAAVSEVYRPIRDSLVYLPAVTRRPGVVRSLLIRFHRAILAGGHEERMELVREVCEPLDALPERERSELFATLDSLYETGGSAATLAKHLHLHKNTVANRIRRVGALTGLDPRRPADRLVLEMVLRIRRLATA